MPALSRLLRRRRLVVPVVALALLAGASSAAFAAGSDGNVPLGDKLVGRQGHGSVLNSDGQFVTPSGPRIVQTGRPMDFAVRPDSVTAIDLTKSGDGLFTVVNLRSRKVLQQYSPPSGTGSGNIGVGGVLYSPDGNTVWVTQATDILRLKVAKDGTVSDPTVIAMPTTGPGGSTPPKAPNGALAEPLPTDLTWAPDGKTILVPLSGYNSLALLNSKRDKVTDQVQVGMAPRDVVVIGSTAYVSNEAGRTPTSTDFTNYSYDSPVVADQTDGRASTGTISAVELSGTPAVSTTYTVGLDPSSMAVHGTDLLVTNSSDDTVSVIDTAAKQVTQTFNVNPLPGQPYGASPNSLAFVDATHLAVSLGRDNAIALYDYEGAHTAAAFTGLVPTNWYPGTIQWNSTLKSLVIADQKGIGALGNGTISEGPGTQPATSRQVYQDRGTMGLVRIPGPRNLPASTATVFADNQWNGLAARNRPGSASAAPVAIPTRVGDPSKIKHVFMIVKENRTYDQVLGDDKRGNGDPKLTQFGADVTPNEHRLATQFPLIDNLYSAGTNSAVGHTWLDAGFVNDYLERSYANYVRDYGQPDAMVYPKSGFLWDDAQAHGVSARVWGEYAEYFTAPNGTNSRGTWSQWYRDSQILEGKASGQLHAPVGYYTTHADIPSLDRILDRDYPNFQTQIPDQYRADLFLQDLKGYEKSGNLPALNMMWVMDDHTAGLTPGEPTPSAMNADNDLAVGRIIDGISHSKYWKDSAVFVVEDDSQNGVDHVDGHRTVSLIASPYAKRRIVDPTYYNQVNVTRTIEQILGLPPMNQLDMAATPMTADFTDTPDFTPYNAVPNKIPLDTLNPSAAQAKSAMQKAWIDWSATQNYQTEDALPFAGFNRMLWYDTHNYAVPYPGDTTVLTPQQVMAQFPQTTMSSGNPDGLPETRAQIPHRAGRG